MIPPGVTIHEPAARRSSPWAQSLDGRRIDLLTPTPGAVDFFEIARTLGQIIRFAGCAQHPVVVAQHTLIALEAARRGREPPQVQALVALHDAHEGYGLGDITTPVAQALDEMLVRLYGPTRRGELKHALAEIKSGLDLAIHAAAGLNLPTPDQHRAIRHYDLVALATERRDFLARKPCNWDAEVEAAAPLPRTQKLLAPAEASSELWREFTRLLPALVNVGATRRGTKRGAA
ncbi:5'-deoxynucleotidase YfbR-like HD superfamily hydrolase [Angulomicrobium tetraedrale]|uniref:5'-deoxynucleotidase YfbR-like HD superfamily hydrolase n=1 Tax=Ancylobacter tetraedralis TaxID=217068 RepID=A0A839ZA07_9HYPH|nr:hypothetical protein [Ancylobacter tetraedralis]MBB3771562.1 5'-deoxynucleotidase YfbR-like HD superfamily hydrolase [Ancylobacter tetraedralis]